MVSLIILKIILYFTLDKIVYKFIWYIC
eukprot:UN08153